MGVLDTQNVRRRKGNRYRRKDQDNNRTTGWRLRAPKDDGEAPSSRSTRRERTQYRVEAAGEPGRLQQLAESAAAGAVYGAGVLARLAGRGLWALVVGLGKGLMLLARGLVALAVLSWRGLVGLTRLSVGAARRARPHVERGAQVSVEAGLQGAKASAQLGRRAAVYSAVQIRAQAEDMKDGFPDVRDGATKARKGVRGMLQTALATIQRWGWTARPPWRRALRVAGATAGACALSWAVAVAAVVVPPALLHSDALAVEDITVAGHDRVAVAEILDAATVEPGDNLLAVDLARVADDVRTLPWIESVQLRRRLPDRLCITVTERHPTMLLVDEGLWFVDSSGEVFKRVEAEEWLDLPVVTGMTLEMRVADPEGCRTRLRSANELVAAFEQSRTMGAGDIGELHLLADGGFVVRTTEDGVALRLGEDGYRRGLDRLDTLLERDLLSLAAVDGVDLSLRNQVVATRKADL